MEGSLVLSLCFLALVFTAATGVGPQPITDIAPPNVAFDCTKSGNVYNPIIGHHLVERAVGSVEAEQHAWPWMALLGRRNGNNIEWFCGGALINEQWVLTALICSFNTLDVVRLGEHDHQDPNDGAPHQDFDVAETVMYPGYAHPAAYHDLALLKLSSRVDIQKSISPVCLPWGVESEVDVTGHTATLTGYGDTVFGGRPTTFLQQVNLTVFPSDECDTNYSALPTYKTRWPQGIGEETLCAGHRDGGKDACQGDAGGPLVTKDLRGSFVLAGIVSLGHGCGSKNFPGLYVNMRYSPHLAWVKKIAF